MIDGGLYQLLVSECDIQGVFSVYLNGELFVNGKVDVLILIDKLLECDLLLKQVNVGQLLLLQDVIVIGGGLVGVSLVIYSVCKGLKVIVIVD